MQALSQLSYTPLVPTSRGSFERPIDQRRAVQARPRVYPYFSNFRKRATTVSRSNKAKTESTDGVCARPQTSTRTAVARGGIREGAALELLAEAAAA